MKRFSKKVISLFLIMCLMPLSVAANIQNRNVKVQIAPFYTEIDYMSVDNRYVEFPLITYKDITYFPMTYNLCERLNLASGFDEEKGLFISRAALSSYADASEMFGNASNNTYGKLYDAVVPTYPVYLNGIKIDNSREEYPLLNFRGVTYFPMTWRFAHDELNFDIEWLDEEYSFKLYNDGWGHAPYPYSEEEKKVLFQDKISVYEEVGESYAHNLMFSYWEQYALDLTEEKITRVGHSNEPQKGEINHNKGTLKGKEIKATVKENGVYIDKLCVITSEGTDNITDAGATEYLLGDSSLIYLVVRYGGAPAPYTQHSEYLFAKNSDGIRKLDWKEKNNLSGIYPDNNGGFYIASSGYSVVGTSRWTNSYSDIYYYNPENTELISQADKHSELNSMRAIGAANGKLYIQAMWYAADKESAYETSNFSAVNSGYYEMELSSGKLKKLYPYISGETFIAPNGILYAVANYAYYPRVVNLNSGKIISFD